MEPHIYCIEGHWDHGLGEASQVEGMLRMNRENGGMPYIRRNCATSDEMHFWLAREWMLLPEGSILYIATHGAPDQIWLSGYHEGSRAQVEIMSALPDTTGSVEMLGRGSMVHFSGCEVFRISDKALDDFMRRSGFAVVSGFTRNAGFLEGNGAGVSLEGQLFNAIGLTANLDLHLLSGDNNAARGRRDRLRELATKLDRRFPDCGFRLRLSPRARSHDE